LEQGPFLFILLPFIATLNDNFLLPKLLKYRRFLFLNLGLFSGAQNWNINLKTIKPRLQRRFYSKPYSSQPEIIGSAC